MSCNPLPMRVTSVSTHTNVRDVCQSLKSKGYLTSRERHWRN